MVIAIAAIVQFQAKRIIIGLIEANASDRVSVEIGGLRIHPYESSISLSDVVVLVKKKKSDNYKKTTIKKMFLDVASLWNFLTGGTLVIERLDCEGGELTMYSKAKIKTDTTSHSPFDLSSTIQRIKTDAIRFQIQDIKFTDFNLILISDSANQPTLIKHLNVRAQDLYLSADSMLRRKPFVEFSLPGQTIVFPKGLSVGFDSLFFSTTDNSIQLDNLNLLSPVNAVNNSYRVHSEKVRMAHFDFETLYTRGHIIIDSIFLNHSNIAAVWQLQAKNHAKDMTTSGLPNLPVVHVRHVIIDELSSEIKLRKDAVENTFKVENSFVTIHDLRHKPDSSQAISARDFDIILAKYNTFLSSRSTSISFDTVRLQMHRLFLLNFQLTTEGQELPLLQTSAFELKQVDWYTLLVNRNLIADEAVVLNPTVHTTIKPNRKSDPAATLIVLSRLKELLNVNRFTLINATAYVRLVEQNADVILRGTNATIRVNDMMESKNVNLGLDAIEHFSFSNLRVKSPEHHSSVDQFSYRDGRSYLGRITYQASDQLNLTISELKLDKIDWNESLNKLTLEGLGWKSVEADVRGSAQGQQAKGSANSGKMPSIFINKLRGGNTRVNYQMKDLKLNALLKQINLETLRVGDTITMSGVNIQGNKTDVQSGVMKVTSNTFSLTDQGGIIEDVHVNRIMDDSLVSYIERISIRADIPSVAQKKISVHQLDLEKMNTHYSKRDSVQRFSVSMENNLSFKDINLTNDKLTIGSLALESGLFNFLHEKKVSVREELVRNSARIKPRKFRINVDSLLLADSISSSPTHNLKANPYNLESSVSNVLFTTKTTHIQSEHGGINLFVGPIEAWLSDSSKQIISKVNSINFKDIQIRNNDLSAHVATGSLHDLVINSDHFNNSWKIIEDNYPSAAIRNLKIRMETNGNAIQFDRLDYNPKPSRGSMHGFEFRPLKDRQAFLDDSFYQTNFMHAKIDSISFARFHPVRFMKDSVLHISSILVSSPNLEVGRDKTHPFFSNEIKLLPTNAFQKLGIKFKVDSLRFGEGKIKYIEKSKITGQEGSIHFTKLQGLVRNVKNIELKDGDSLYIRGSARFLDSANVSIRVRESYRDTLAGFLMTTQVGPFHTSILNPSLIPMVGVQFQSGFVDTLQMRAIGREYLSLGTMKFFYHDLKVDFINKNDTSKHSIKNAILKFAANNFVIRTNNSNRIGKVYFERDRQRAVFQYWVKMILSGVTTSVGAKSNKKQIRKYLKKLNQKKLPPIGESLEI